MPSKNVVLRNGRLLVGSGWHPTADAVAVGGGRIVAIGPGDELVAAAGRQASVIDLGGDYVLPGMQDAHVHPVQAGLEMNRCNLSGARTLAEYTTLLADYAAQHPDNAWVLGGGWYMEAFPGGTPEARVLDAVIPNRPAFLPNRDHHGAWVNTRALEMCGIDSTTPDPVSGRIERYADGSPTGTLHEAAVGLVADHVPRPSSSELEHALLTAQRYLFSLGLTGWQDALVGTGLGMADSLETYCALSRNASLKARVVGALWWDPKRGSEQLDEVIERRAHAEAAGFRATTIKFMLDGVCENYTAAMLDPYRTSDGAITGNRGMDFIDQDAFPEYIAAAERHGFQAHIHALGDRAVRASLDAFEHARASNGPLDLRHHIAHLQVVHPTDVARFAELGVVANMQMLWACNDRQMAELTLPFLSPAAQSRQYLFGSLRGAGARLAAGSDWPVSSPNPFAAIHVAVNRTPPPDELSGFARERDPLLPAEALSAVGALGAFTAGSAYVNHCDEAGSIRLGNHADFTIIDTDILTAEATSIGEIRVHRTVVAGETVYVA